MQYKPLISSKLKPSIQVAFKRLNPLLLFKYHQRNAIAAAFYVLIADTGYLFNAA